MAVTTIRVSDEDLAEIDRRAQALGTTRTAFLLRAALDRASAEEERLAEIEERLGRLEDSQFGRLDP